MLICTLLILATDLAKNNKDTLKMKVNFKKNIEKKMLTGKKMYIIPALKTLKKNSVYKKKERCAQCLKRDWKMAIFIKKQKIKKKVRIKNNKIQKKKYIIKETLKKNGAHKKNEICAQCSKKYMKMAFLKKNILKNKKKSLNKKKKIQKKIFVIKEMPEVVTKNAKFDNFSYSKMIKKDVKMYVMRNYMGVIHHRSRKSMNKLQHALSGNKRDFIRIAHWNMGSALLQHKMEELELAIRDVKPDIIGISESNLTADVCLDEVSIIGYKLYTSNMYNNPKFAHTRIVMYVKDGTDVNIRSDLMSDESSTIWCEVNYGGGKKLICGQLYREHMWWRQGDNQSRTDAEQLRRWKLVISQWRSSLRLSGNNLLIGDFNINFLKWDSPSPAQRSLINEIEREIVQLGVTQCVDQVTRSAPGVEDSLIDHVWSRNPLSQRTPVSLTMGGSDHKLIYVDYLGKNISKKAEYTRKRKWRNYSEDKLKERLREVDWELGNLSENVHVKVGRFTEKLCAILDDIAPTKSTQLRENYAVWMTDELQLKLDCRNKLKMEAIQSKCAGKWAEYKTSRNSCNREVKKRRREYETNLVRMLEEDVNSKKLWRHVNKKMESKNSGPPSRLIEGGKFITKPREIATILNNYYYEKIENIRKSLGETEDDPCATLGRYVNTWRKFGGEGFKFVSATQTEVKEAILNLSNSKTEGIDTLCNIVIKDGVDSLCLPLTDIINRSFESECFPNQWKLGQVRPLYKGKGSPTDKTCFRPVNILSAASKVAERVAFNQIVKYFVSEKLINSHHHAYRTGRSTTSALIEFADMCSDALENGHQMACVMIDMTAAFDSIDHPTLKRKLRMYNLSETAVNWLMNYMGGRSQSVLVETKSSGYKTINTGVPQGSILGPLIYTIFTNELPSLLNEKCQHCKDQFRRNRKELFGSGCAVCGQTVGYADDLTHGVITHNRAELEEKVKETVEVFTTALTANKLQINRSKTHALYMGTRQWRQRRMEDQEPILIGDEEEVALDVTQKLLGVIMNRDLSWRHHLVEGKDSVNVRMRKRLGQMYRACSGLAPSTRLKIANGRIKSILEYAMPLWGGTSDSHIITLQQTLSATARYILNVSRRTPVRTLMSECGWLSVSQSIVYTSLIELWKTVRKDDSDYWRGILSSGEVDRKLRSNTEWRIPHNYRPKLDIAKISWRFRSVTAWNRLPVELRSELKLSVFKSKLRNWTKVNIPCTVKFRNRFA